MIDLNTRCVSVRYRYTFQMAFERKGPRLCYWLSHFKHIFNFVLPRIAVIAFPMGICQYPFDKQLVKSICLYLSMSHDPQWLPLVLDRIGLLFNFLKSIQNRRIPSFFRYMYIENWIRWFYGPHFKHIFNIMFSQEPEFDDSIIPQLGNLGPFRQYQNKNSVVLRPTDVDFFNLLYGLGIQ